MRRPRPRPLALMSPPTSWSLCSLQDLGEYKVVLRRDVPVLLPEARPDLVLVIPFPNPPRNSSLVPAGTCFAAFFLARLVGTSIVPLSPRTGIVQWRTLPRCVVRRDESQYAQGVRTWPSSAFNSSFAARPPRSRPPGGPRSRCPRRRHLFCVEESAGKTRD